MAHVGTHGQGVTVVDGVSQLVDCQFVARSRQGALHNGVVARLSRCAMCIAVERAQRHLGDGRIAVNGRVLVAIKARGQHRRRREQHAQHPKHPFHLFGVMQFACKGKHNSTKNTHFTPLLSKIYLSLLYFKLFLGFDFEKLTLSVTKKRHPALAHTHKNATFAIQTGQ